MLLRRNLWGQSGELRARLHEALGAHGLDLGPEACEVIMALADLPLEGSLNGTVREMRAPAPLEVAPRLRPTMPERPHLEMCAVAQPELQ
eukprot:13885961-Alexandrium_andersonii.AAC.1